MLEFKMQNSDALLKELGALDTALQKKALNYMLGQAVNPAVKDIRMAAPVGTGALKQAMGRKVLNKRERGYFSIANLQSAIGIGATRKALDTYVFKGQKLKVKRSQAYKLRWIEEGVKQHKLYRQSKSGSNKAKAQRVRIGGRWINKASVTHPGIKKNPFMTRTFKKHESQIPDRTIAALQKWMAKHVPQQHN